MIVTIIVVNVHVVVHRYCGGGVVVGSCHSSSTSCWCVGVNRHQHAKGLVECEEVK